MCPHQFRSPGPLYPRIILDPALLLATIFVVMTTYHAVLVRTAGVEHNSKKSVKAQETWSPFSSMGILSLISI